MAALAWAGVAYAKLKGGESIVLEDSLHEKIDGTGTKPSLAAAKGVILEIVDNPTAKMPRLFFAPDSATCSAEGVGVRSIGLGEKAKILKTGDTIAEITYANGVAVALVSNFNSSAASIAVDKPCTIMVNYYS